MLLNIPDYPNYLVDTTNWKIFSTNINDYLKMQIRKNHYYVSLSKNNKHHSFPVHHLVYISFFGAPPKGYDIHHIDENPINNDISNLQLLTHSEHLSLHKKGNTLSNEVKMKISSAHKLIDHHISKEHREKMAKAHRGVKHKPSVHLPQRIPIILLDKQLNIIKEYSYINAVKEDGFIPADVCYVCEGKRKTHKGFIFKYKSQYN